MSNKGFIWNLISWECECDKTCGVDEYLNYENLKCRKKLVDRLVDECTETVEELKLLKQLLLKIKIVTNVLLAQCILCYFGYFLQLMLVE